MKKQMIGSVVFLAAFLFGTAVAQQAARATAPAEPPVVVLGKVVAESSEIEENDKPRIRYGWYAFDDFKGISEASLISIYDENGNEENSGGGVFTKFEAYGDQGFFSSKRIKINGNHVSFETEKLHGISYKFEGTFLSDDWSGLEGEKPLYGTLKKFVKGKLVAEVTGNLKYFEPHCWH